MKRYVLSLILIVTLSSSILAATKTPPSKKYFNQAIAKCASQNYAAAVIDLNKAIQLRPSYGDAYSYRAGANFKLGRYTKAQMDCNKALKYKAKDIAGTYIIRGRAKVELKNYTGAISDYTKAMQIKENYAAAYYYRGLAKDLVKDTAGARADLQKAKDLGNPAANDALQKLQS